MFSKILIALFLSSTAMASYESAERTFGKGSISLSASRKAIIELIDGGYYFSAVPWMKDYLVKHNGPIDSDLERAFDKMLYVTGVRSFESLPESVLRRSNSGNIHYIMAKRHLKQNRNQEALNELNRVNGDHPAYPFVAHMKGTINSILNRNAEAETQFKDCVRVSERMISKADTLIIKEQLQVNRDYCTAGIARTQFAAKDFVKSELNYLDIQKESPVWPEILFEEAWTSYYAKNYNRTLGKLVSYKAPVFDFVFKPEVEVLKALAYLKLCLYDDAKKTVDEFYDTLLQPSRDLRNFINGRSKDYRYYYGLMSDFEGNRAVPLPILENALRSIRKDGAFLELKGALGAAVNEYNNIRKQRRSTFNSTLTTNLKVVLDEYRSVLGAYVRAGLVSKYAELYSSFVGMSYIKLEVLALRKEKLYQSDGTQGERKRGDVKYIERNDKQYFWTFNGEFWADELGDYVFALRSEC